MPHRILDIVSKYPEVQHISDQVHKAAVEKHTGNQAERGRDGHDLSRERLAPYNHGGDRTILIGKKLSALCS